MTKLDAVNRVLVAVGRDRVKALDTDGASPAAEAERCLDQCELDVQALGWHYNTRNDVELTPDANDHIAVPTGVITIDTDTDDQGTNVTVLGDGLFNLDDNTDEFDSTLKVAYTLRYSFHCIPQLIQEYIVACTSVEFNLTRFGTRDRHPYLEGRKTLAWGMAVREDEDKRDTDILATLDAIKVRGYRVTNGAIVPVEVA